MFGTIVADHAAGALAYIVRRTDILPLTHPLFQNGNTALFKITIGLKDVSEAGGLSLMIGTPASGPLIPALTDYVYPAGMSFPTTASISISSSASNSPEVPWWAFDGDDTTYWSAMGFAVGQWIQAQFSAAKTVTYYDFLSGFNCDIQLQGSNDGSTWTTLDTQSYVGGSGKQRYYVSVPMLFTYYRIYFPDNANNMVLTLQLYGY